RGRRGPAPRSSRCVPARRPGPRGRWTGAGSHRRGTAAPVGSRPPARRGGPRRGSRSPRCGPAAPGPRAALPSARSSVDAPAPSAAHTGGGAGGGGVVPPPPPGAVPGAVGADRGGGEVAVHAARAQEAFAGGADEDRQPVGVEPLPAGQHVPVLLAGLGEPQ